MKNTILNLIPIAIQLIAIYLLGVILCYGTQKVRGSEPPLIVDRVLRLELRIQQLEQENSDLRAQLRARDSGKQPATAATQPKVTMQSIEGCFACEQWFASERPKLVQAGWLVDRETVTTWPAGRVFPRWRVCFDSKCVEIENCSAPQFMTRLRELVEQPAKRKVWKRVRNPVQLEGGIDDGYELVDQF